MFTLENVILIYYIGRSPTTESSRSEDEVREHGSNIEDEVSEHGSNIGDEVREHGSNERAEKVVNLIYEWNA